MAVFAHRDAVGGLQEVDSIALWEQCHLVAAVGLQRTPAAVGTHCLVGSVVFAIVID